MAAEDDEIDILGDFTFDSCLSKSERPLSSSYSELLQCDYTVHPQWLLDTATTACWYDNQEEIPVKSEAADSDNLSDEDIHPSTSGPQTPLPVKWTNTERELLQKGVEIYGIDSKRLSIFLGTRTQSEVQLFIETEFGINLDVPVPSISSGDLQQGDIKTTPTGCEYGEILTENEIPASIEEVICMVTTAEPTVPNLKLQKNPRSILKKNLNLDKNRSLLKKSHNLSIEKYPTFESDEFGKSKKNILKKKIKSSWGNDALDYEDDVYAGKIQPKKSPVEFVDNKKRRRQRSGDFQVYGLPEYTDKKSKFNISLTLNKNDGLSRLVNKRRRKGLNAMKRKASKKFVVDKELVDEQQATVMQIVTGSGHMLPLSKGEQVIKLEKKKESDVDSDIEIDIDSEDEQPRTNKEENSELTSSTEEEFQDTGITKPGRELTDITEVRENQLKAIQETQHKPDEVPDSIKEVLASLEVPKEEYVINPLTISELEKFLCPDFFEGRPAKTPGRYQQIRSHLVSSWRQCRPHYLTKTAARHGLRNCGDVNCIGRVHSLMEQLGAINFNCEQVSYIRPLNLLLLRNAVNTTQNQGHQAQLKVKPLEEKVNKFDISRQRKKKIVVDGDGGYTITHTEFGETCEAVSEPRQPRLSRKKPISLMYCRTFTQDHPAPYNVVIWVSALILMDFHAHTSRAEIMGLLGGCLSPQPALLSVRRYVPCDSKDTSGTHCDMCPVSQSLASQALSLEGLQTVGWHHSHPLFPPQPSAQDILSQAELQAAFAPHPFLAVILSPCWRGHQQGSHYRCLLVKRDPSSGQQVAYRFRSRLHCDLTNKRDADLLLQRVSQLHRETRAHHSHFLLNMKEDVCTSSGLTHLDKCIISIRQHLKSCREDFDPALSDYIIRGIHNIVR